MRVVLFGTAPFAVPSLERLIHSDHIVVLCVTQPDRPCGRGLVTEPPPVKQAALRLQVPIAQPQRPTAGLFSPAQVDVGVVIAYGRLIGRELLDALPYGMVGVHPSLLPKYRGAAPITWALLNGDPMTGVSIFRLSERLDDGEVLRQRLMPVRPDDTGPILTDRLAELGAEELVAALDSLANQTARATPQDHSQATLAPKLTKADGRINWRGPAEMIERQVRALVPWPGAWTQWQKTPVRIWRARVKSTTVSGSPGTIVDIGADGLSVAAGQGIVVLEEVQLAGRRRMSVREFLSGHPMKVGDRVDA